MKYQVNQKTQKLITRFQSKKAKATLRTWGAYGESISDPAAYGTSILKNRRSR